MVMPYLTISILYYRQQRQLDMLAESLGELPKEIEVVVCNDDSHDNAPTVPRGWAIVSTDMPDTWALSMARNYGLLTARGEWFWTTDADHIFEPDFFVDVLETARRLDDKEYVLWANRGHIPEAYWKSEPRCVGQAEQLVSLFPYERRCAELANGKGMTEALCGSAGFRTKTLRDIGGWDLDFVGQGWGGEDTDLYNRMNKLGAVPVKVGWKIFWHLEHPRPERTGGRDLYHNVKMHDTSIVRNGGR